MAAGSAKGNQRRVKPAGRLADLVELKKVPTLIVGPVGEHLLAKKLLPTDRRQDVIHPSEMAKADWCPRQTYYRLAGVPTTNDGEKFSNQLERIFQEGHDIHTKWQNWLAEMGWLWGRWKCPQDHYTIGTGGTWPDWHCPECFARLKYKEVPLDAERTHLIAGHADGAIERLGAIIEIKSIGMGTLRLEEPSLLAQYQVETTDGRKIYDLEALWKGLKRPLPSHLRQVNVYLALCRLMGLPFDRVVFIYEYKATQDVKEFTVKASESVSTPLLDAALDVKYYVAKGMPPERPGHTGRNTKVCKTCPWFDACWENDESHNADTGKTSRRKVAERGSRLSSEADASGTESADRPNRARRQRTDAAVHGDDAMGRVRGAQISRSGNQRKIRRIRPRTTEGNQHGSE